MSKIRHGALSLGICFVACVSALAPSASGDGFLYSAGTFTPIDAPDRPGLSQGALTIAVK